MSDNVTLPATREVVATDLIGGAHYQRIKVTYGVDGVAADVTPAAPLPVHQRASDGADLTRFTPRAMTVTRVASDGVAVVAQSGPVNGGYLTNPINSDAQGLDEEQNLYVDLVNAPGSTDANGNITTTILVPGQGFQVPALATGVQIRVNSPKGGHTYVGVVW